MRASRYYFIALSDTVSAENNGTLKLCNRRRVYDKETLFREVPRLWGNKNECSIWG